MSRIVTSRDFEQVLVAGAGVEQVLIDDGHPVPLRYYVLHVDLSARPTCFYLMWVGQVVHGTSERLAYAEVFTRDRIYEHEKPEAATHWNDGCRYIAIPCERAKRLTDEATGHAGGDRVHRRYLDDMRRLWRPLRPYMTAMLLAR
jgi:hypothetical protein